MSGKQRIGNSQSKQESTRRSKGKWLILAGPLLFLAFAAYVGLSLYSNPGGGTPQSSGAVDRPSAPDITVATTAGDYRLSQQRGKVVVLYFSFPG